MTALHCQKELKNLLGEFFQPDRLQVKLLVTRGTFCVLGAYLT
jgi:hypothetical protein